MVKTDIYNMLKEKFPHLKNETVKGALDVIFETIIEGLVERTPTVIRGLGTITTRDRPMPTSNLDLPKTDKEIVTTIKFYPSKGLKRRLNKDV
jgi:nucleoid DNA-binding protein